MSWLGRISGLVGHPSRASEIAQLETLALSPPKPKDRISAEEARERILAIIRQTLDKTTVAYGLTALSRLDFPIEALREEARVYNAMVRARSEAPGNTFYAVDLPLIDKIVVREGDNYYHRSLAEKRAA